MTLLGRLQRVVGAAPPATVSSEDASTGRASGEGLSSALARLRVAMDRRVDLHEREPATSCVQSAPEAVPTLVEALGGGAVIPTTHGPAWALDTCFGLDDRHGDHALTMAFEARYAHLEAVTGDARLRGFDPREALYLDIEATGLEHGAGTMAFMIGLGSFDGRAVRVRQLILREPDEEKALLELVWEAVDSHRFLVSFNGKSFDLSVLQSRLVMNRFCTAREGELKLVPHLDLLHLGRGLFRKVWQDVRLQTLEARVLGFVREDDMPGSLAPTCWFRWLREADPRPLAGIARHNLFDVLSMVSLGGLLAHEARPVGDGGRRAAVALNLAALYARRRAPEAALAVLDELPPLCDHAERLAAHALGATCARRAKDALRQRQHLSAWLELDPLAEPARKALARLDRAASRDTAARARTAAATAFQAAGEPS